MRFCFVAEHLEMRKMGEDHNPSEIKIYIQTHQAFINSITHRF